MEFRDIFLDKLLHAGLEGVVVGIPGSHSCWLGGPAVAELCCSGQWLEASSLRHRGTVSRIGRLKRVALLFGVR